MFANQVALIRRELWEHRSLYVVPAVIGIVIVLLGSTGQVAVSAYGQEIDMALLGMSNVGEQERGAFIAALLSVFSGLFVLGMWILIVFYSLDALYAERKDRSILFWRSLPVTDAETVLSKLLTAVIVVPLITFAFIAATHLCVLFVTSFWVGGRGADGWQLVWASAPLLDVWAATLIFVVALAIWLSPFVGWFLLVSAYTKRSPLLMASLPVIVLPILERNVLGSTLLFDAIYVRTVQIPLGRDVDISAMFDEQSLRFSGDQTFSLVSMLDVGRFLGSLELWIGLLVCGLLTAGAIYVRRFRDES